MRRPCRGAHVRVRTGDLFLTKEVLCQLSYVGPRRACPLLRARQILEDGPILDNHRPICANLAIRARLVRLVGREGIEPPQSLDG